mgnify:CR=1 FL=1
MQLQAIHFKNQSTGKPGPAWQLLTLLRYRMLTHYKSPAFLGPRIGDKVMFGVLILSLYWDIGKKEDPQSIAVRRLPTSRRKGRFSYRVQLAPMLCAGP